MDGCMELIRPRAVIVWTSRTLLQVVGHINSQVPEAFPHDLLHLIQRMPPGDLARRRNDLLAPRIDDPEVSPSAAREARAPARHRLAPAAIAAVPRVERARHEELLRGAPDDGIGEYRPRVLAPPSSAPLDKVGEDGPAGRAGGVQGRVEGAVSPVPRQVDVLDRAELDVAPRVPSRDFGRPLRCRR